MTSAACHYPVHLIDVVRIADLERVTIRPVLPQDCDLLGAFFRALTPQSRYSRFMTHWREVPEPLVRRFAHVDHCRHIALVAGRFDERGQETIIGEARYVIANDNPHACEFALAIADTWHRRGLGSLMLEKLKAEAKRAGIHLMTAETLAANVAMQRTADRAGFLVETVGGGIARLEKRVAPALCS